MRRVLVAVLVLSGLIVTGRPSADAAPIPFQVIVHHQVKGAHISRSALSSIFLKQAPRWSDGSAIKPVDQSVRSTVRKSFSGDVLAQGIVEVQIYWQRRMSLGTTPPPVKTSDEEVVSFVASTPGAIGYVSSSAPLPESVKAVQLTD